MRALTQDAVNVLTVAASPIVHQMPGNTKVGQTGTYIDLRRRGLIVIEPAEPGRQLTSATDRGKKALRVHAAYLASLGGGA